MKISKKIKTFSLLLLGGLIVSCSSDEHQTIIEEGISLRKIQTVEEAAPEDVSLNAEDYFQSPYDAIDAHARDVDESYAKDITSLAKHLIKDCKNDLEKARAIYIWLTQNISYDQSGFNKQDFGTCSAESVLKSRISVCEGFSNLYLELGKKAGLDIVKVSGYAKGLMVINGKQYEQPNHAWNRIKINGDWRIFDATWGEGYATANSSGELVCVKEFDNYWFNVDPYQAIFDHFPVSVPPLPMVPSIDLETFKKLPLIKKSYFETGFNAKSTYRAVRKNLKMQFPKSYDIKTPVKILQAPANKTINIGEEYTFKLVIPAALKVAILDENSKWHYLEETKKGIWTGNYTPKGSGQLSIAVNTGTNGNSFNILMAYDVE